MKPRYFIGAAIAIACAALGYCQIRTNAVTQSSNNPRMLETIHDIGTPPMDLPETGAVQPVYVQRRLNLAEAGWFGGGHTAEEIVRATGFFVRQNEVTRFVTVRHVFSAEATSHNGSTYTPDDPDHRVLSLDFDIRVSTVPFVAWREVFHPTLDLAVLNVGLDEQTRSTQNTLTLESSPSLLPGGAVKVIGWPEPVATSTRAARLVKVVDENEFLIEPGLDQGFSGAPVIDAESGRVLGMVVGRTTQGGHSRVISAPAIHFICKSPQYVDADKTTRDE